MSPGQTVTLVLPLRALPPSDHLPRGRSQTMEPAEYEPHEVEYMTRLRKKLDSDDPAVKEEALNAMLITHEAKVTLDARLLPTDEEIAPSRIEPESESEQELLFATESETLPALNKAHEVWAARRDNGQSTLALPTPDLPDPEEKRIGKFSDPAVSGAPRTQLEAAILVYPKTGSQRLEVLRCIVEAGDHGRTDFEIERALNMRHQTASARRNELAGDGWIEDSGQRRATDTGTDATVWILSEAGAGQWKETG